MGITPLAGDHVKLLVSADGTGTVEEILPRRNVLVRPPVANIDQLVIVVSTCEPSPNALVIDRMIVAGGSGRTSNRCLSFRKSICTTADALSEIYGKTGLRLFCVSPVGEEGTSGAESAPSGENYRVYGKLRRRKIDTAEQNVRGVSPADGRDQPQTGPGQTHDPPGGTSEACKAADM